MKACIDGALRRVDHTKDFRSFASLTYFGPDEPTPAASGGSVCVDATETTATSAQQLTKDFLVAEAKQYLYQCLSQVTILTLETRKYRDAWNAFLQKNHHNTSRNGATISNAADPAEAKAYVVCELDTGGRRGYRTYHYDVAILWLLEFHLRPQLSDRLASWSELPRALLPCVFGEHRNSYPRMRNVIRSMYMRPGTVEIDNWLDSAAQHTGCSLEQLTFLHDSTMLRLYEDNVPLARQIDANARAALAQIKGSGSSNNGGGGGGAMLNLAMMHVKPETLVATTYLHMVYCVSRLPVCTLRKAQQLFGANANLMQRLFPIAMDMLNGNTLAIHRASMLDMYKLGAGVLLSAINSAVEDVRRTLFFAKNPRELDQTVMHCYQHNLTLTDILTSYVDIRHKLLAERKLTQNLRWVHVNTQSDPSKCQSFVDFLLRLQAQLQDTECSMLYNWLETSATFPVDLQTVLHATRLTRRVKGPLGGNLEKVQEMAEYSYRHVLECNRRFVVLRFPELVRYSDVSMTLQYLCQLYPREMRARQLSPKEGYHGEQWSSQICFAGVDCEGPFLIAQRCHLDLIHQLQLLDSLQQPQHANATRNCSWRNMPVFPILTRLYFGQYEVPASPLPSTPCLPPQEDEGAPPVVPLTTATVDTEVEDQRIKLHGYHVVAQVLAHWLHLPSERDAMAHWTRTNARSGLTITDTSTLLEDVKHTKVYTQVPRMDDPLFHCCKYLHLFADQLRRARGVESFPQDQDFCFLGDFLEMNRPRCLRIAEFRELFEYVHQASRNHHSVYVQQLLAGQVLSTMSSLVAGAWQASNYNSQEWNDLNEQWVPLVSPPPPSGVAVAAESPPLPAHWLAIYVPLLNNCLPAEFVPRLLSAIRFQGRGRVQVPAAAAAAASSLLSAVDTEHLEPYLQYYQQCFVAPHGSHSCKLRKECHKLPMQALVTMLEALEERVCRPVSMATLMQRHMRKFDLECLFGPASLSTAAAAPTTEENAAAGGWMRQSGHSVLPLKMYPVQGQKPQFVFYEEAFGLVVLTSVEYARFVGAARAQCELAAEESAPPTTAAKMASQSGESVMVDLLLRYANRTNMERVKSVGVRGLSYRNFCHVALQLNLERDSPTPQEFGSLSSMIRYINQYRPASAVAALPTPMDQQQQQQLKLHPILESVIRSYIKRKQQQQQSAEESSSTGDPSLKKQRLFSSSSDAILMHGWDRHSRQAHDARLSGIEEEGGSFDNLLACIPPETVVGLHLAHHARPISL